MFIHEKANNWRAKAGMKRKKGKKRRKRYCFELAHQGITRIWNVTGI